MEEMLSNSLEGDHFVGEQRPSGRQQARAGGLDSEGVKILLMLTRHVHGGEQESQSHRGTISRRREHYRDLLTKKALLLDGHIAIWTGTRIDKTPFGSLVVESCLRIIGDLKSAIEIGEGKEIRNDVLYHRTSFLVVLSSSFTRDPIR